MAYLLDTATVSVTMRPRPDLRIAATALAHNLTLVTGNERHFRRIPDLPVENWLADSDQ